MLKEVYNMKSIMIILVLLAFPLTTLAANDPNIKGEKRRAIQAAMQEHIGQNTVNGHYILYDTITDDVLKLKLAKLHDGIVKKADYYISCADFYDRDGTYFDLDFMVIEKDGRFRALQGIVHKVGDVKRKYHLED
ncbi:MAG: hypothetical protein F4X55_06755 [Candidatus Dadabacteria bacterium]|nr:hypothetical protein [Candidatus Dadabacteria bacterium]